MKEDTIYLLGGVAVGLVAIYLVKQYLDSAEEKKEDLGGVESSFSPPVITTAGIGAPSVSTPPVAQGAPTQWSSPTPQTTTTTTVVAEQPLPMPYDLVAINPQLQATSAYDSLFGGCDFPLVSGSESVCVKRVQDAFDIDATGVFDTATQEALDDFIEEMPNRDTSVFSKFDKTGCIDFNPITNETVNVCGLNHDQYLKILFQMGIPISQSYE